MPEASIAQPLTRDKRSHSQTPPTVGLSVDRPETVRPKTADTHLDTETLTLESSIMDVVPSLTRQTLSPRQRRLRLADITIGRETRFRVPDKATVRRDAITDDRKQVACHRLRADYSTSPPVPSGGRVWRRSSSRSSRSPRMRRAASSTCSRFRSWISSIRLRSRPNSIV